MTVVAVCLQVGLGFAWFGHFSYQHNKPASFIYPTYSFISDLKMCFLILTGQATM